jgi:parvulin-like peptidyl-prolyl isomerase
MSWMREHMKILMWVTAVIFILPFVGGYIFRYYSGMVGGANRSIATVNGETISSSEFSDRFSQLREQRRQQSNQPLGRSELETIRKNTFTQLVNQTILQQTLTREGGGATEREIRQLFMYRDMFRNQQGRPDPRRVQRFLERLPQRRQQQLVQSHRRQIETVRMNRWISSQVALADTESKTLVTEGLRPVNLYGIFVDPATYVSDTRVQEFYETNKSQFSQPPTAYVRQILLRPDTGPESGPNPLASIKETIETIRRRFRAGDAFSELAREYSDDPDTAKNGGLMGWVTPDELSPQLSNAIFTGSSVDTNSISKLVRSDSGYHLFYVEEGPVQKFEPLNQVSSRIRSKLLSDSHWNRAQVEANRLHQTLVNSDDTVSRMRELALLESHSEVFSSRNGHYGWVPLRFVLPEIHENASAWNGEIARNNLILDSITESIASLNTNELSEPIKHDFGYHLFYASGRREPDLANLSDTQTRSIQQQLLQRKKRDYTESWLATQRRKASISLNVPIGRVGGPIEWLNS